MTEEQKEAARIRLAEARKKMGKNQITMFKTIENNVEINDDFGF